MKSIVDANYAKLKLLIFVLPCVLLCVIGLVLYSQHIASAANYAQFQKSTFLYINHHLGQYGVWQINLTYIGNALVFLSFLSVLIVYVPRIWEALIAGSLVSLVFTTVLKKLFSVPRPAAVFNNDSFFIIGERLSGKNSFPSGHSITLFTIITVLMFAFMPNQRVYRVTWLVTVIFTGLLLASTRVGVGAHYPIDVIVGSIVGYISGLAGIFLSQRFTFCNWINNRKCYPFFMGLFFVCALVLVYKIFQENLFVFYLAFASLAVSLYKITHVYIKK